MKITIPLLSYGDVPYYAALGRELRTRGHETRFITTFRGVWAHAQRVGLDVVFLDARTVAPRDAEGAYHAMGIDEPDAFVRPEWAYYRQHRIADLVRTGAAILRLVEAELDAHRPDIILQFLGGETLRRALQRIGDARGIPNVWIGWTPIPGQLAFHRTEFGRWEHLRIVPMSKRDPREREAARVYLDEFRGRRERVRYAAPEGELPTSSWAERMRTRAYELRVSGLSPPGALRSYAINRAYATRERIRRRYLLSRVYPSLDRSKELLTEGDYAFFPVQWWNESRTSVRAPFALDLANAIVPTARALPEGFRLLVKDHPNIVGSLAMRSIRAINEEPNTRWLCPYHNAHEVARSARVVVVLNNTVGYESILQGSRVVTLADEFYRGVGMTVDAEGVADLPRAIRAALAFELSEERILEFVAAVLAASYPGTRSDFSQENIWQVADSLIRYVKSELPGVA